MSDCRTHPIGTLSDISKIPEPARMRLVAALPELLSRLDDLLARGLVDHRAINTTTWTDDGDDARMSVSVDGVER